MVRKSSLITAWPRRLNLSRHEGGGGGRGDFYHATSSGETTWFGFAWEVFRLLGADEARVRHAPLPLPNQQAAPKLSLPSPNLITKPGTTPADLHRIPDVTTRDTRFGSSTLHRSSPARATITRARCPLQLGDGSFSNSHRPAQRAPFASRPPINPYLYSGSGLCRPTQALASAALISQPDRIVPLPDDTPGVQACEHGHCHEQGHPRCHARPASDYGEKIRGPGARGRPWCAFGLLHLTNTCRSADAYAHQVGEGHRRPDNYLRARCDGPLGRREGK